MHLSSIPTTTQQPHHRHVPLAPALNFVCAWSSLSLSLPLALAPGRARRRPPPVAAFCTLARSTRVRLLRSSSCRYVCVCVRGHTYMPIHSCVSDRARCILDSVDCSTSHLLGTWNFSFSPSLSSALSTEGGSAESSMSSFEATKRKNEVSARVPCLLAKSNWSRGGVGALGRWMR